MNNVIYALVLSSLAGLSTIIGYLVVLFKIKEKNYVKFITLSLSFSISIMIGISIFDLIPNSFKEIMHNYNLLFFITLLILSFLGSFVIIRLLNKLLNNKGINNNLYKLGILNMLILVLHNLPEGIATFLSSFFNLSIGLKLTLAIMLHNIPEGISIAVPIYYATKDKKRAFLATFLSGVSEPLGGLISFLIFRKMISITLINIILLVVASLMITLSIEEILPKAISYNKKKYLIIGLLSGGVVILLNMLLFN